MLLGACMILINAEVCPYPCHLCITQMAKMMARQEVLVDEIKDLKQAKSVDNETFNEEIASLRNSSHELRHGLSTLEASLKRSKLEIKRLQHGPNVSAGQLDAPGPQLCYMLTGAWLTPPT